mgnify:CR=1 FL=1
MKGVSSLQVDRYFAKVAFPVIFTFRKRFVKLPLVQKFSNIPVVRGHNRISPRFDLTGKRFHKLMVVCFHDYYKKSRRWECVCDCGKTAFVSAGELIAGKRISCGCERFTPGNNTKYKYDSKQAYTNTKAGALKRGYTFSLSFEEFQRLVSVDCDYCGSQSSGLDRIDNHGHYTLDNLVACCGKCNRMKNVLHQTEFLAQVKRIYETRIATPNG